MLRLFVLTLILANGLYFAWSEGYLRAYGFASKEEALSHAVAHDVGMALVFDGAEIVLKDVNISQAADLSILFA